MNYFIRSDYGWLTRRSIHKGWKHAFDDRPVTAKAFSNLDEAKKMQESLAGYKVESEIRCSVFSIPSTEDSVIVPKSASVNVGGAMRASLR